MSLDDKLVEIDIPSCDGCYVSLSDENIAEIKQVFADEGYVSRPYLAHLLSTDNKKQDKLKWVISQLADNNIVSEKKIDMDRIKKELE